MRSQSQTVVLQLSAILKYYIRITGLWCDFVTITYWFAQNTFDSSLSAGRWDLEVPFTLTVTLDSTGANSCKEQKMLELFPVFKRNGNKVMLRMLQYISAAFWVGIKAGEKREEFCLFQQSWKTFCPYLPLSGNLGKKVQFRSVGFLGNSSCLTFVYVWVFRVDVWQAIWLL